MKNILFYVQVATLLTMVAFGSACNESVKKDLSGEQQHAKLIKNIGNGNGNVQCSLQDKAGNLWFGTLDNGLYKYDGRVFHQLTVKDGLKSNCIYSLLEDKEGNIWIGTEAGLCVYDGKTFTKIEIPLPKSLPPNNNKHNRHLHIVHSMMQAKNGKIWVVTMDGVYVYDGRSFTLFIIDDNANGFMTNNDKVERILEDKAGNIWFGGRTNKGVYRYDGKSVTNFKLENLFQDGPKPKAHSWGWPQIQDKNGNIWFSNWGGIYRYDGKSFTSFTKKDGLNNVTRIIEDQKGNIWIGSADGLRKYDGTSFAYFKDGLINPWIWTILEDSNGNLWVGTRQTALYLFDGKRFINYSEAKQ